MLDEALEQFFIDATQIQLQIDEYFVPDLNPPDDYQGPQLIAVVHACRLVTLGSAGRLVRELSDKASAALLQAAIGARDEKIRVGVDTATGRTLTILKLRVDHARGPSHSFACTATINHHLPHALPPQWSALLRMMRDTIGLLDEDTASAWDRALIWTSPVSLGPLWQAGAAVRVPHLVTTLAHDGELYLRTGQPPEASSLYRFAGGKLTCLDTHRELAPVERCFILPCGGGRLRVYREWQEPLRIMIRADDSRGIYVQRG